jgi:hypothetical protein
MPASLVRRSQLVIPFVDASEPKEATNVARPDPQPIVTGLSSPRQTLGTYPKQIEASTGTDVV